MSVNVALRIKRWDPDHDTKPHWETYEVEVEETDRVLDATIFEKMGLKNGDVISRVNGNELTDPARAMGLLQELRGSSNVSVEVNRNRQPMTISYEIR